MSYRNCTGMLVSLGMCIPLFAQAPKPAALPPINPAQARLAQTFGGVDGPCHAIGANEASETLFVVGERGTLMSWPRSAWMGVRVAEKAPDSVHVHDGPVVALAAHGSILATAGADRKIRIWDIPVREAKLTLETGQMVRALAISADGKRLAAGDDSGTVQLFELPTGKPVAKLTGHTDWILTLAFSPDGTRLVSGGDDGQALLWDVAASKKILAFSIRPAPPPKTPPAPIVPITALTFRPDGKAVAAGDFAGQVHLLNPSDGKLIRSMQAGHASSVSDVAFHPGGMALASSGRDRVIKLWNPDSGQAFATLEGHTSWVQGIVFIEKGTRLASVGADQTVRVWDLTPKK